MTEGIIDLNDVNADLAVRRDEALDKLFAPQAQGYLGADVAHSIPLDDERVLWLFGDTLIGSFVNDRRSVDIMPRNSAALVTMKGNVPEAIEWLGKRDADFFVLPERDESCWFWPGTGFVLDGCLCILGYDVVESSGPCESLSFRVSGTHMYRIADFKGPPEDWKIESIPFTSESPTRSFFCSAYQVGAHHLHLLGFQHDADASVRRISAVMARIAIDEISKPQPSAKMEILSGSKDAPQWAPGDAAPVAIYRPGVSECSLYHDEPRGRFLATTYDTRDGVMRITSARAIEGPWCEPVTIFRIPEFRGPNIHHAYTMRMHPHLAASRDEMVFSYVVNGKTLEQILDETDVYYPRFLRADLRQIQQLFPD